MIQIAPNQQKVFKLNLASIFYKLPKGMYRIKVNLLKIPDDLNKPSEMTYTTSKYLYFSLSKNL
jgi:hypothetical protein